MTTYTTGEFAGIPTLLRNKQPVAYLDGDELFVSPMFAEQALAVLTQVFAPDDAQRERIGQACGDPGSITPRVTYWDAGHLIQESVSKWSARAVLAVLSEEPVRPEEGQSK